MSNEPSLEEAALMLKQICRFFEERLLGIAYTKQLSGKAPTEHHVASGFITESHGYPVFVTAGHALDTIKEWIGQGCRESVSFIVPTKTGKVEEIPWPPDLYYAALHWYDAEGNLDFGIVPVPEALARALHVHDISPITSSNWWNPDDQRSRLRLIVGFSGQHLKFAEVEQFVIPAEPGKWKPILRSEFSGVASRVVMISHTCAQKDMEPKIRAEPHHNVTESVAGLSGGMVVDVFFGANISDFHWVGVQSKETRFSRGGVDYARDVTFIDSRVVSGVIDEYIAGLIRDNPDLISEV